MTKKKGGTKKTATVRDLSVRKDSDVKGGSIYSELVSVAKSIGEGVKSIGDALSTAARKG